MKISVAICTWNRSHLLRQTLESLCRLDKDDRFDWELIVVDNNSSDDTQQVLSTFEKRVPLVSLFEKTQGHSQSRNRAVESASGDYLVWTDNDVLLTPHWLSAYYEAFQNDPDFAFFGGEISPQFEQPPPSWIEETWDFCKPVYATRQLGDQAIELDESQLPYGANYAVRMDVQRQFLYDTTVGRKGSGMVGDDETSLLRSLLAAGHRGRWIPRAGLKHYIPVDRLTEKYVRGYFYGCGVTNTANGKLQRNRLACFGEAMHHGLMYRIKRHRTAAEEWVSHMIRSSLSWGELKGMRKHVG